MAVDPAFDEPFRAILCGERFAQLDVEDIADSRTSWKLLPLTALCRDLRRDTIGLTFHRNMETP